MIDWFSTACCLYTARSKNENRAYFAARGQRQRHCRRLGKSMAVVLGIRLNSVMLAFLVTGGNAW
jgi:hypothetical protein